MNVVDDINIEVINLIEKIINLTLKSKNYNTNEDYNHAQILKKLYTNEINEDSIYLKRIIKYTDININSGKHTNMFGKITHNVVNFFTRTISTNSVLSIDKLIFNAKKTLKGKTIDDIGKLFIYTVLSTLYMLIKDKTYKYNFTKIKKEFNLENELKESFVMNMNKKENFINFTNTEEKTNQVIEFFIENKRKEYKYDIVFLKYENCKEIYDKKFEYYNNILTEKLENISKDLPEFDNLVNFIKYMKNDFENIVYNYIEYEGDIWFKKIRQFINENGGNFFYYLSTISTRIKYWSWIFRNQNVINDWVHMTVSENEYNSSVRKKFIQKNNLIKNCKKLYPLITTKTINENSLNNMISPVYNEYLENFRNYYYYPKEIEYSLFFEKKLKSYTENLEKAETKLNEVNEKISMEFLEKF